MLNHFSRVWPFVTRWSLPGSSVHQKFSRQEYWSGLPRPPPGALPDPGIEPTSLMFPALAGRFFTASTAWEAPNIQLVQTSTVWFHPHNVPGIANFIESESTLVDARGPQERGGRTGSWCLVETEFQFRKVKYSGDGWWYVTQQCECA